MVGFVETTLLMSIERFSPEAKDAIRIWNVFLPKPDVPPAIAANYRQVGLITTASFKPYMPANVRKSKLRIGEGPFQEKKIKISHY